MITQKRLATRLHKLYKAAAAGLLYMDYAYLETVEGAANDVEATVKMAVSYSWGHYHDPEVKATLMVVAPRLRHYIQVASDSDVEPSSAASYLSMICTILLIYIECADGGYPTTNEYLQALRRIKSEVENIVG